jgi:hypothetical protein
MPDNAPVAESKSAVDKLRGLTFAKREYTFSTSQYHSLKTLETERRETQDEISKLTLIIEDQAVDFADDEIMDINNEINRLLEMKRQIESQIHKVSEGKVSYGSLVGSAALFKYFGRAKEVKRKQDEEERATKEKRKVFEVSEVRETSKEDIIRGKMNAPVESTKATKKTRFDEDEED